MKKHCSCHCHCGDSEIDKANIKELIEASERLLRVASVELKTKRADVIEEIENALRKMK